MIAPLAVVLVALAALLVTDAPSQVFGGLPLTAAGMLAVGLVLYAALALPRVGDRAMGLIAAGFLLVVAIKLLAAAMAPPTGLLGSYWAAAAPPATGGATERSTDFIGLSDATRVDDRLALQGEAFPVHFFNDAARFNFGPEVQPGRDQLPFFVRWDGYLLVPTDGARQLRLAANGTARVWLDGAEVVATPAAANGSGVAAGEAAARLAAGQASGAQTFGQREAQVALAAGLHALRVEYSRPEARVPRLQLDWQRTPGGTLEAVGGADVRTRGDARGPEVSAALGLVADLALAVLTLAWLVLGLRGLFAARSAAAIAPSDTPGARSAAAMAPSDTPGARSAAAMAPSDTPGARSADAMARAVLGAIPLVFLVYGMLLAGAARRARRRSSRASTTG